MFGPLKNLQVVEFAGIGPGPFLGMVLADFGANVVKIDRIGSASDMYCNRGKKSIACDLKQAKAKEVIEKLISSADVLIDPFRPGVLEKLGLGPDRCMALNPRLIFTRVTGFGQTGPYASMAGHDINYVAMSGVLSKLGRKDEIPLPAGNLLADFAGGTNSALIGILMCLYEREKSGKGQVIDSAMQDGLFYLSSFVWEASGGSFWNRERGHNILDGGTPWYEVYETQDGKYMTVGPIEPQFYAIFIQKMELSEYAKTQFNQSKWPEMKRAFTARFKTRTQAEWDQIFGGTDACVVPLVDFKDVAQHPHNKDRDVLITFPPNTKNNSNSDSIYQTHAPRPAPRLSRTPGRDVLVEKPNVGGNTLEILNALGYNGQEIKQLTESKSVFCHPSGAQSKL